MRLLTVVVKNPDDVEIVRAALAELDIRELTSIESRNTEEPDSGGGPITARLQRMLLGLGDDGTVMMGLVEGESVQRRILEHLRRSGVDLSVPGKGFAFTTPIEWASLPCAASSVGGNG
jgi:hypothetical protein